MLQNRLFIALASRSGCGAPISDALARSSIVFCNWVTADRIGMAASRLLGVAAACVILLSFAAEGRKSYGNGCIKAAKVICQQIFSILVLILFLLKFLLKSASKSSFYCFGVEIRLWSSNFRRPCPGDHTVGRTERVLLGSPMAPVPNFNCPEAIAHDKQLSACAACSP